MGAPYVVLTLGGAYRVLRYVPGWACYQVMAECNSKQDADAIASALNVGATA